jgi:hypothetical protein
VVRQDGLIAWARNRERGFQQATRAPCFIPPEPRIQNSAPELPTGMKVTARRIVYTGLGYLVVGLKI